MSASPENEKEDDHVVTPSAAKSQDKILSQNIKKPQAMKPQEKKSEVSLASL